MNNLDSISITAISFSLSTLILLNVVHYYRQDRLGRQILIELKEVNAR